MVNRRRQASCKKSVQRLVEKEFLIHLHAHKGLLRELSLIEAIEAHIDYFETITRHRDLVPGEELIFFFTYMARGRKTAFEVGMVHAFGGDIAIAKGEPMCLRMAAIYDFRSDVVPSGLIQLVRPHPLQGSIHCLEKGQLEAFGRMALSHPVTLTLNSTRPKQYVIKHGNLGSSGVRTWKGDRTAWLGPRMSASARWLAAQRSDQAALAGSPVHQASEGQAGR